MIRQKKKLCTTCRRGREQLELDERSPVCCYIGCYTDKGCTYYLPDRKSKRTFKLFRN